MFSVHFIVVLIHKILLSSKHIKPTSVTIIFNGQDVCVLQREPLHKNAEYRGL